MPLCGRCIASGAPCDYGISNQGGRWKNGQKMGVNRATSKSRTTSVDCGVLVPESPVSDQSFHDAAGLVLSQQPFPAGDPGAGFRHSHSYSSDSIWGCDLTCAPASFQPFTTAPLPSTSAFPSPPSSTTGSLWMPATSESDPSQDFFHPMMPPPLERIDTCSCLASTLTILQTLHQKFPQMSPVGSADPSTLSYAAVLDINEQAASCCSTMLRCSSCRNDDSGYSFVLLSTLMRKTLSMIEWWVPIPDINQQLDESSSPGNGGLAGGFSPHHEDDRRFRAEISLIGIRKIEEVLAELRQAAQTLRGDYDRLACASLAASLSARAKSASERLSAELEPKLSMQSA